MKLLLFSGGVESTCLAYSLRPELLLTIDYGQKSAAGELRASSYLAGKLGLQHEVLSSKIDMLGMGDLVGGPPVRQGPATEFWPFRNQYLITLAAMRCLRDSFREIIIGTVSTDSIHEDGTTNFIGYMNMLLRYQSPGLSLIAPAIEITTKDLVKSCEISRDLLGWTFSCYRGAVACGQCRGCAKTIELMKDL